MSFTPSAATTRLLTDKFSGTGNPLVNWSAVWNNAATTFTGIRFDVTDTASAAGSLLMDLRVGGVSALSVSKSGVLSLITNATLENYFSALGVGAGWSQGVVIRSPGPLRVDGSYFALGSTEDTILRRDAANTLAQRNGVLAQTFRIYNTFTDASNYERGKVAWSANVLQIGTEKAGTGSARALELQTDGVTRQTISTAGRVSFGTASAFDAVTIQGGVTGVSGGLYVLGSTSDGNWGGSISLASFTGFVYGSISASTNGLFLGVNAGSAAYIPPSRGFVVSTGSNLATSATSGFMYVPACAGTPTGVPAAQTGSAPIVIDTTNNKLYFYSGGSWRDAGP